MSFSQGRKNKRTWEVLIKMVLKGGQDKKEATKILSRLLSHHILIQQKNHTDLTEEKILSLYSKSLLTVLEEISPARYAKEKELKNRFQWLFAENCEDASILKLVAAGEKKKIKAIEKIRHRFSYLQERRKKDQPLLKKEEIEVIFSKMSNSLINIIENGFLRENKTLRQEAEKIFTERSSDFQIIKLLQQDSESKAFRELDQRLRSLIPGMKTRHAALGEDSIQEAYNDAFVEFKDFLKNQYRGEATLKTVFNNRFNLRCIDKARKKKKESSDWWDEEKAKQVVASEKSYPPVEINTGNFVGKLKQVKGVLINSMENLKKGCKSILNDYIIEGYSASEIAKIHNIKDNHNASARIHKCFKKLRDNIKSQGLELKGKNRDIVDLIVMIYRSDY